MTDHVIHETLAVSGKQGIVIKDGDPDAPNNVIPSASAAKVVFDRLKENHVKRCWNYERIQGMIDGNPPYNSRELAAAGLSDMCNVNWKDGDSLYKSVALAYWSLFNDVETMIDFKINIADDQGLNAEWGRILSEEWDRVVRSWPNFQRHMSFHQGELIKFGVNAIIWPDERDWRFKAVNVKKFLTPDQTQNDTEEITTIAIEHTYTAQYLWGVYENGGGHWDKKALGKILYMLSNIAKDDDDDVSGCLEIQKKIRNGDTFYDELYNDDIILVSILQKEYDDKVTHMMIHPRILPDEFVYMYDRQYKEGMREAAMYFSFQPGEETIHGNKGIGQSMFSAMEAITQLDCSVLDQARRAGSLLLKAGANRGQDERVIKFVAGGVIDVGEAEIAQNTMGNNVQQTVEVSKYFKQKTYANNNISGHDPAFADRNVQSARQTQIQATKEAKVQKNMISHYYEQLDYLFREMTRKMLHAGKGSPGYDYVKTWIDRCIARQVPEQLFDNAKKAPKTPDGLPTYMEVFASRSAGSGSQIADQMEMQQVMQILPTLGERGRQRVLADFIAAFRGHRYVDRYYPEDDRDEQPTGHDTLASIENNQLVNGQQVIVSPDNAHIPHMTNHMRLMSEWMKAYQERSQDMFDRFVTMLQKVDDVFQTTAPHFIKHLLFAAQDPTREAMVQQFNAEWAVIANFGDMIANNAAAQRQAEFDEATRVEEEMRKQQEQNTPAHIKARGDIELKKAKLEAQILLDRKRVQLKFLSDSEATRMKGFIDGRKVDMEMAIKARKELSDGATETTTEQ